MDPMEEPSALGGKMAHTKPTDESLLSPCRDASRVGPNPTLKDLQLQWGR